MISLNAIVAPGSGEAAGFMALPWVRDGLTRSLGFEPYPGTLNVRLVDATALAAWRRIRLGPSLTLTPPPTESCGAALYPMTLAPDLRVAAIVPDVTRYGDDVLELVAANHVRGRLGLRDGDRVTLHVPAPP